MTRLETLQKQGQELERLLRLKTFPLAVRMLRTLDETPLVAKRPLRDLGHRLDVCQGFAMARRERLTMAMTKEDMWCPDPVIGYGLADPPDYFFEGHSRYPVSAMTLEAGRKWARDFPRLPVGDYVGIVCAPLQTASFEPDLFLVYCDPSQLTNLLRAKVCVDGEDVTCRVSGHSVCAYAIVPLIVDKRYHKCQVASPCRGERIYAGAREDEIMFSAQIGILKDLVEALRHFEEQGAGYPHRVVYQPEHELRPSYLKIAELLGMKLR